MVAAGFARPLATGARGTGEMEIEMSIRNIHGQGRNIEGNAASETFVDFGSITDNRFVRVRIQSSMDGSTIVLEIDGEMCGPGDAPSLQVLINGTLQLDTADGGSWPADSPKRL
jgi:hypothetical protein